MRGFWAVLSVVCGVMVESVALFAVENDRLQTVSNAALQWKQPSGAPRHSDVCFSIRWLRKEIDPFEKIREFHGTRFDWLYAKGQGDFRPDFFREGKQRGYVVSHATSVEKSDDNPDPRAPRTYRIGRAADLNGQPLTASWQDWKPPWGCAANPDLTDLVFNDVRFAIEAGADYILVDDPNTASMLRWGGDPKDRQTQGCFCPHCLARFRIHLKTSLSAQQIKAQGIEDLDRFDYKQWILQGHRSDLLRREFEASFHQAVAEFWRGLMQQADRHAGRHFPFAANNGSYTEWDPPLDQFDFAIGELSQYDPPTPASLWKKAVRIARMNKAQAFTLRSTDAAQIRHVLGLSYALGTNFVCPWDVWIKGSERYYGEPRDFNDLFAFVRGNARWLDSYEYAAAVGKGIRDDWYGDQPPVGLAADSPVSAFIRAVPGDSDAPVVVHLVDASDQPRSFELNLNPERFFPGKKLKFQLLIPQQQSPEVHQRAETSGDFSAFTRTTRIPAKIQYGRAVLEIPALHPWVMLIVSGAR